MRTKRKDLPNGVTFRAHFASRPYMAWLKVRKIFIYLGYYATPSDAAVVADFARFILWGPSSRNWRYSDRQRMHKPASAPPVANLSENLPVNPWWIFDKLNHHAGLDESTRNRNLQAYNKLAEWYAGQSC